MADLLIGGAVGAAMGEITKYTIQTIHNGRQFVPTLEKNEETLNELSPLVKKINDYNHLFGRSREEIERLEKHMREGKELVRKSKKLARWKFLCYSHYQTKLKKKDEELLRYLAVNLQVENRRDVMEMLAKVNGIFEIIMRKEGLSANQIGGLWGVPGEFVAMEDPLNNLKVELIKDGVSVHVLHGLGGSGKNNLAKKLCWDSQIRAPSAPAPPQQWLFWFPPRVNRARCFLFLRPDPFQSGSVMRHRNTALGVCSAGSMSYDVMPPMEVVVW
ncbi:hypothetical protein TSUD_232790 [Trifolium subterraneum]|uniref:RPW8 domain-containing protein n=1 Tax=Trifolium subterraneum TaxID=3900 RepID=A0A2Z6LJ74_TRISU|nr:hypothetical protein TSUD_232790 [Trifolium subterraneum]